MSFKMNKKKAFTLTELLVVVVIIGILATVALPKFNKVLMTRRTTEAEEIMRAIRTEQERRCALDKPYVTNLSALSDIVPNTNTDSYKYVAQAAGVNAQSKQLDYQLQMPSYTDGRICCEGVGCSQLNKDYPTCEDLRRMPDYEAPNEACTASLPGETGDPAQCQGTMPVETRPCSGGLCGTETRPYYCDVNAGEWKPSLGASWDQGACTPPPSPHVEFERDNNCPSGLGYRVRAKTTHYDCNGNETGTTVGDWISHCIVMNMNGTGYYWKNKNSSLLFSGYYKQDVQGFLYQGLNWWYNNDLWQLCIDYHQSHHTIVHDGGAPSTPCGPSNVGAEEVTYYVSSLYNYSGPPGPTPCWITKYIYECVADQH